MVSREQHSIPPGRSRASRSRKSHGAVAQNSNSVDVNGREKATSVNDRRGFFRNNPVRAPMNTWEHGRESRAERERGRSEERDRIENTGNNQ